MVVVLVHDFVNTSSIMAMVGNLKILLFKISNYKLPSPFYLDGVQMLTRFIRPILDKLLHVHVISEAGDEYVYIAHNLQYIQAHLQGAHRKVVVH